jgi:uncharacterized membrane protein YraQ (UPF0718 family)
LLVVVGWLLLRTVTTRSLSPLSPVSFGYYYSTDLVFAMVNTLLYTSISVAATAICIGNAYHATQGHEMRLASLIAYLFQSKLYVLVCLPSQQLQSCHCQQAYSRSLSFDVLIAQVLVNMKYNLLFLLGKLTQYIFFGALRPDERNV